MATFFPAGAFSSTLLHWQATVRHQSVQIRAGPAEERGRVCRFNEPSDEVAFLNLRTSGFFCVGSSTVCFFCPKPRCWNYFFQIAWNTKKLFDSQLLCSELEVVPFWPFSCSKLRFWNFFFQIAWNTQKLFRLQVALLLLGSSTVLGFFMFKT